MIKLTWRDFRDALVCGFCIAFPVLVLLLALAFLDAPDACSDMYYKA